MKQQSDEGTKVTSSKKPQAKSPMKKKWTWVALFSIAIVGTEMYQARKVQATPAVVNVQNGCSVANLKGTYAFRRTGVNNVVGGPIAQMGIDIFNGDGTRGPIRSTRSTNGDILDWADFPPNGTYTVDRDCTGSFFDLHGTKTNNVIILDGGKRFFLLSMAPDTVTMEEGEKLQTEDSQ